MLCLIQRSLGPCKEQFCEADWPLPVVPFHSCHPACHRTPAMLSPILLPADVCWALSQDALLAFFSAGRVGSSSPSSGPIQSPSLAKALSLGCLGSRVPSLCGKVYARCQNGGLMCMDPTERPVRLSSLPASGWALMCAPAAGGGGGEGVHWQSAGGRTVSGPCSLRLWGWLLEPAWEVTVTSSGHSKPQPHGVFQVWV